MKRSFALILVFMLGLNLLAGCESRGNTEGSAPRESDAEQSQSAAPEPPESAPEPSSPGSTSEPPAIPALPEGAVRAEFAVDILNETETPTGDAFAFQLYVPADWTAAGTALLQEDREIAAVLPAYAVADKSDPFAVTDALYGEAKTVRECVVGGYAGKCYHMQDEVSEGGMTFFRNELVYCWPMEDSLVRLVFYPAHGVGIGTQREDFEASILGVAPGSGGAEKPESGETATFALGLDGQGGKELRVGDSLGGWTLTDLQITYHDGAINMLEATFAGNVILKGVISPSPLMEDGYDFRVAAQDEAKMPCYIAPEATPKDEVWMMLNFPDGLAGTLDIAGETECEITVSGYRFIFAYMMAPAQATVVSIELAA